MQRKVQTWQLQTLTQQGENTLLEGQCIIQLFGIDSKTDMINFWFYPKSTTTVYYQNTCPKGYWLLPEGSRQ